MKKIALFFFFSGLLSCNPEKITTQTDKDGVVTQMPFLWKSSTSDGVRGSSLYTGYIVDGKGILVDAIRKSADPKVYGEFYLQLKDINSGQNLWTWDEFHRKHIATLHRSVNIYEGKMLVHDGPYDYMIDYRSGKTIWKKNTGLYGAGIQPAWLDNKYYLTNGEIDPNNQNRLEDKVYVGDASTGEIAYVVTPKYSEEFAVRKPGTEYYVGSMNHIEAFKKDNMDYLIIPFEEKGPVGQFDNNNRSFFGLYNLTNNSWVYERIPLSLPDEGSSACLKPIVDGDRVYLTSLTTISCHDLMTGKSIWDKKLTDVHTSIRDFIKVGDKIILNGHNATLYCVNATTGTSLWSQKSSAFSSDLYHQDGIVYWIITKTLAAADIETGKLLWDMPSPDGKVEKREDSWFTGFVTGIPAKDGKKGKIFATTNLNLYCFEAVR